MKRVLLFLIIYLRIYVVYAQIGIPHIVNYTSLSYKGGTQNWKIDQDKNGLMYFANNEGLLTYNGKYWKIYPLPNKTITRSVKVAEDGKIYVGGQDEIGYFYPNKSGTLEFNSLRDLIPKGDKNFADVWDIIMKDKSVFFRTTTKILQLKDGAFSIYKNNRSWEFIGEIKNQLFAQNLEKGLLRFTGTVWETVSEHPDLKNSLLTSILPFKGDTLLLTTNKNGLYYLIGKKIQKLKNSNNSTFSKSRIYDALQINKDWYAFATVSSGSYIVNKEFDIIQQFSSANGLQKNNIRCIYKDKNQNLWLGLDDGIDFIAFNNAVKFIYPDIPKQTSSYATRILDNKLYIGTSNGLYYSDLQSGLSDLSFSKNPFHEVKNAQGQIWNLNIINNQLLISQEEGGLIISNGIAKQLYQNPGTWLFESISNYSPSKDIIAGTYDGLKLISFQNGQFTDNGDVPNIGESLRFLVYDANSNSIWASHPYRGIYNFRLSSNKQHISKTYLYTHKDGLPSSLGNYVAKIKNRIVIATLKGIYEFDEASQRFVHSKTLYPIFGDSNFQYLNEDKKGNIWFVTNKKVGVVDFDRKENNQNYSMVYFPELTSQVVAGFESIYHYDSQNIFIGSNKGVIHINYLKYLENLKPLSVNLTQIKILGKADSILYGGYFLKNGKISSTQDDNANIAIPHQFNSLHFEYSSTLYEQQNNIEFSYQLVDFDNDWSEWSAKSEKDYTNLPNGTYNFKVKSRNNLGNESKPVFYKFTIKPAWYQTYLFYFFCFLIVCFIIYLMIQRQKRKHVKEQEYLRKAHQLEIEHNEKEIVSLRNQKLQAEVEFKNKELASATMHLMQRGKLLSKIKEEILPIVKTEDADENSEEFKKILSLINDAERADSDWENFAIHFDHVHSNFLTKLKEKVPVLSANDLKLCAYLKMNLSSKEIAQLMSITLRAVEVSRYRLRKKLEVTSDTNLFDYLIEITSN